MSMLKNLGVAEWTALILATIITRVPLVPYGV